MFKTWDHIGQFINTGLLALIGPSAGTINYGLFVLSGLSVLGRPLPPHMGEDTCERREELGLTALAPPTQYNTNFVSSQRQRPIEAKSDGGSSHHHLSTSNRRSGNWGNPSGGNPDGSSDKDDGDEYPCRNNHDTQRPSDDGYPVNHGGGGSNPGGGGGGNGPNNNGLYSNSQPRECALW
ncbi:uncharacterized protein LACBIDRAFT_325941 [Laccaria bicolor S238N-H82]|uniref:Predicted protein n=1 Tax=Laccaria bicolor (strain S238N-H82 / ATCC MYA-4686) TaxID=486041 RepID=B0D6R8_LACBS|nr:uncharacterized protein LACBIDRAFT_325941 [Laccaria bicolor S238N-H82]EDR09524.1 predicted protein [Laccaria bicolor S238N-H82]|eukprot:XP_001879873.1 predicted protein [Laccaria bicolor S238N-H82]